MLTVQPPGNHQLDDVWSDCPATQNYGSTGYGSITRDDLLFLKPSLGGGFKYSLFSTPNAGEMIQFEWVAQKKQLHRSILRLRLLDFCKVGPLYL